MSAGNVKDKGSNYGSNYSYQLSVLQLLDSISTATPCCPTAATEVTLQQVLAAIQGGSLFFNNLVIDQGGVGCPTNCPTYSEVSVWNGVGFTITYYDANGAVVIPVGPLIYVNPQYVLNDILLQVTSINTSTARTPAMFRTSASGTVTAGKRSVSIRNAGSANGVVLGANLLPGETVNFDAASLKDTLGAIAYNGTGTDLLIITIV
jgi:hypothetical protein